MNHKLDNNEKCLNCGATVKGNFCQDCGQHARDNTDRSLSLLLGQFFGNLFFLDNRFLKSFGYLFGYPGRMTSEFLAGQRKKFVPPITLFLFVNLIFFLVNPLTDYSIALYDQMYAQPYSPLIKDLVQNKLETEELEIDAYSMVYQKMSDNISKTIMIMNAPLIALLIYLMAFKKRQFYFDSLIFSLHFFTLFMLSWIMSDWTGKLTKLLPDVYESLIDQILYPLWLTLIPLIYAVLSIKKFLQLRWYWSIPAGIGVLMSVLIVNLVYRFIVFFISFLAT